MADGGSDGVVNARYESRRRQLLGQIECPPWCMSHVEMEQPGPVLIHSGRRRVVWCPGWPAGTRIELHAEQADAAANDWRGTPHIVMTGVMLYGASLTIEAMLALVDKAHSILRDITATPVHDGTVS